MSGLQNELKKRNPFDSPEQEAILNIVRTSDQIQNRMGKLFRKYGITGSQYNVLRILRGEGKSLPSQEIASRMIQVVPAMTGLVDRLEQQGLVTRERCAQDRRVIYISLTEEASSLLKEIDGPIDEMHLAILGHLSPQELQQLSSLLEKSRLGLQ